MVDNQVVVYHMSLNIKNKDYKACTATGPLTGESMTEAVTGRSANGLREFEPNKLPVSPIDYSKSARTALCVWSNRFARAIMATFSMTRKGFRSDSRHFGPDRHSPPGR
jgi:hypothetical protein